MREREGRFEHFEIMRGLHVRDNNVDEVVVDGSMWPPTLAKTEDDAGFWFESTAQWVLLKSGLKVFGVVEHLGSLFSLQLSAVSIEGLSTEHHVMAQWSGIYVVIVHLQEESTAHGAENVLGSGDLVHGRQRNLLSIRWTKQGLKVLWLVGMAFHRLVAQAREDSTSPVAGYILGKDRNRSVEHRHLELVWRRRKRGGSGMVGVLGKLHNDIDNLLVASGRGWARGGHDARRTGRDWIYHVTYEKKERGQWTREDIKAVEADNTDQLVLEKYYFSWFWLVCVWVCVCRGDLLLQQDEVGRAAVENGCGEAWAGGEPATEWVLSATTANKKVT